jgi:nucleolar protein 56
MTKEERFEELRQKMLKSAREGIREAYSSEEYALIQAINAYLETNKSYNLAYERLTEWAGIYFPEKRFTNARSLADFALSVAQGAEAKSAMGREMNEDEKKSFAGFAELSKNMDQSMKSIEVYLKAASNRLLPNTTYLTDEKIAAELLSRAGSMERLATMPAGTVQLLGAEKSLFKHLKFHSKPPKYGVIFKLPEINSASRETRGRIARAYATKLTIALKADYYTKKFIAKELKVNLDKSIAMIKSAPVKEKKHQQGQENWRKGPEGRGKFNKFNRFKGRRGKREG